MEMDDPTKGADCAMAVKRARRKYGAPQRQATPLTIEVLHALQATCDDSLVGQRDRLLLQLGYETLRRRSEIIRFRFEDLIATPAGTHRILLRRSKTDQFGQGKQLPVSKHLVSLIHAWRGRLDRQSGYLIPRITKNTCVTTDPIPANHVNRVLQRRQRLAGLELDQPLTGHSFRVGGALDLLKRGVPLEKIMLRGGWKSESSALRYLREWVGDDVLVWEDD
ncbi:MAG: tyrosine-type recombinase/integrase [Litorivicinus sp.]